MLLGREQVEIRGAGFISWREVGDKLETSSMRRTNETNRKNEGCQWIEQGSDCVTTWMHPLQKTRIEPLTV
jgi:hypothetical protein